MRRLGLVLLLVPACSPATPSARGGASGAGTAASPAQDSEPGRDAAVGPCRTPPTDVTQVGTSHDGTARVWEEQEGPGTEEGVPVPAHLCLERAGARRVLLRNRAARPEAGVEDQLAGYADFVFSRDDRVLFFTTHAWSVARAAHAVDLATGREWFLTDGQVVEELDRGPYRGNLFATHFRLDDAHPVGSKDYRGRIITFTVVDRSGKTLRKLPEEEAARARVLDGR